MTKKELDEEIEYIQSNRTNQKLLRPFDVMQEVIIGATNVYTNISLFMNDYIRLYNKNLIDKEMFNSAMNDLYLLALLHTKGYEDLEEEKTIREFNSLEEIQKYYNSNNNTYIFDENDDLIDLVVFNFDLNVKANIVARDIKAGDMDVIDISARDVNALNIYARDINARDISYYAVCFAYENIKCSSIKGCRENSKHFVLDGELEVEEDE